MKVRKPLLALLLAITAFPAPRSSGGLSNPDNFVEHRRAQPFSGRALHRPEYLALWASLPADSQVEEVVRNFFIRRPVRWEPVGNNKPSS